MSAGTFLLLRLLLPFLSNHKNKCCYIFNIVIFKLKKTLVTSILLQAPILTHLFSIPEYSEVVSHDSFKKKAYEAAYLALSLQPPSRFCTSSEFVMLCLTCCV